MGVGLGLGLGLGLGVTGKGSPNPNHGLRAFGVERGGGAVVGHRVCRLAEDEKAAGPPVYDS